MDYNFKVETKEAGQRNKYGDSYYHYIVENASEVDFSEFIVKQFCTQFLKPAKYSYKEWRETMQKEPNNFGLNFASHYTEFKKIGDRKYVYKVTQPSTH